MLDDVCNEQHHKKNSIRFVKGSLLDQPGIIVQQCNCVTVKAHGLSQAIKKVLPYADIYSQRTAQTANTCTVKTRGIPGSCVLSVCSDNFTKPIAASLMGQIAPGRPFQWARVYKIDPSTDSPQIRLNYFRDALEKLLKACQGSKDDERYKRISFPYLIGCGLAGGRWKDYLGTITDFAEKASMHGISVFICQLEK